MRHRERGTPTRPPGQDQSGPEAMLDALLDGAALDRGALPGDDQDGLQPVADVLAALRAAPAEAELTGQARALAAFRAQPSRPHSHRARRAFRLRPVTALAAGVVVAALAAGAYEGDLPGPLQQWAHHTFGLTASRTKTTPPPGHSHRSASARPARTAHQHPRPTASPTPTPPRSQYGQHGTSHRHADQDGRQHDGQQGSTGPAAGGPGSSPSPSSSSTPQPSTSPAVQPSVQSSTSPGSHHAHGSPSPPP